MPGKMLGQTGQSRIHPHVTRTRRRLIEQACRRFRSVASLGPPIIVEELHQAAVRAREPAAARQLNGGVASGLRSGPQHHAASLRATDAPGSVVTAPASNAQEAHTIDVGLCLWPWPATG